MIIPLGPEEREVRRIPWITVAVLAANVLVFVLVSYSPWAGESSRHAREASRDFLGYWLEHPNLEMPAEYARYIGSERAKRESALIAKAQATLEARGYSARGGDAEAQRRELDARASEWVKAMQATPQYALGFVPAHKTAASLLTSMFMHGGWIHLLGNMLIFLMTAPLLEDRYGRLVFPLFYLLAGAVAAWAFALKASDSLVPLVGASGAIAGVMGAFCVRLFRTRMVYLVLPIPIFFFLRFRIRVPAWVVFPFWFLEQLAMNAIAPDAGVAWGAHIGGFLFGMAFAFGMKAFAVEERWIHPAIEKEIGWQQHPALEKAGELRAARDFEAARAQLKIGLAADPTNVDGWRTLFDVALDQGDRSEAARAATRRVELLATKGDPELAVIAVAESLDHVANELPCRFWIAAGGLHERTGDARSAYECYEAAVCRFPHDPLAARALVRMAEILAKGGEPEIAWRVVRLAQSHPACLEGWRAAADRILVSLPPASAPRDPDEPVPVRGAHLPRGVRALPSAAVLAEAPAVAPLPAARETRAPAPRREPGPSAATAVPRAAPAAAAPARTGFFADATGNGPARRPIRPAILWSIGGVAAVAVIAAGILVWAPWTRRDPPAAAPALEARVVPRPAPAAPPAAAPAVAPAALADASEVPLRITFQSPFAAGQVIVKAAERQLLSKDFDFGKESGGGALDEVVVVPSGELSLRVWITSQDRSVRAYGTLSATIPALEPKSLEVTLDGQKVALAVR